MAARLRNPPTCHEKVDPRRPFDDRCRRGEPSEPSRQRSLGRRSRKRPSLSAEPPSAAPETGHVGGLASCRSSTRPRMCRPRSPTPRARRVLSPRSARGLAWRFPDRGGPTSHEGRGAAQRGPTEDALTTLAEHERRFPRGALSEERLAARIHALCGLGRDAEAQRDLMTLSLDHPQSQLLEGARQSCAR